MPLYMSYKKDNVSFYESEVTMSFRLNPNDPNEKKMPIQKGISPHKSDSNSEAEKESKSRLGFTKTSRVNANNMLKNIEPSRENLVGEPLEMSINDKAIPGSSEPDCIIPPTTPGDDLHVELAIVDKTDTIAPPEKQEINPGVVDDTNASNKDNDIFKGSINALVLLINEMADELEAEGYSVSMVMNSSLFANIIDSIEGLTNGQVKQVVREYLANAQYDEVCNLNEVIESAMQAAGIGNPESMGLSHIALINMVVSMALEKAESDNKPVTLSDIKQIIDEIFFKNSQQYKESVYNDDNAEWRVDTDVKDFIRYILQSNLESGVADDNLVNAIYKRVIAASAQGELLPPNFKMVNDLIWMILNNNDDASLDISTVTNLIDVMLKKGSEDGKSSVTYGDIKEFIINTLNDLLTNDCVLPPVEPPVGPNVEPVVHNQEKTLNRFVSSEELTIDKRNI